MKQLNYRQALINKIDAVVEQNTVTVGSVKTAYLSAGSGFPVICLHGAGAGAVTWYPVIGTLAKHFHIIAPDIVGYGESDKPNAAYDRPYFAAWLRDFCVALDIPQAHVIGSSQGGSIALQFALENPQMADQLVLVAAGALGAHSSRGALWGMLWLHMFPSAMANRFMTRYLVVRPENRDPNHGAYSLQVIKKAGGKNVFVQGRGAAVAAMPEEDLRRIQHQTLVVWGEDDRFFSVTTGEAAAQLIPNVQFRRIQEAGHVPFWDQPQAFNEVLLQFLESID